jgi:hypothetical protein
VSSVGREVEGVDILFVTRELVKDALAGNVPDLGLSVMLGIAHLQVQLTRIILSSAPVARNLPLGLKQTLLM